MKFIPNALTITRILLTPVFLVLLMSGTFSGRLWALAIFIIASISDWLDGKLARVLKARSRLGQFLDPFADKVLVLSAFIALPILLPGVIPWWSVLAIALRDVVVTVLRTWREAQGRPLAVMPLARTKTLLQLSFLILFLLFYAMVRLPGGPGAFAASVLYGPAVFWSLMVVVALTVYTGVLYLLNERHLLLARSHG